MAQFEGVDYGLPMSNRYIIFFCSDAAEQSLRDLVSR